MLLQLALIALAASVFLAQVFMPIGNASGVLYAAVVFLTFWTSRLHTWIAAWVCSGLTLIGNLLSPSTSLGWIELGNPGLEVFAIWTSALVTLKYRHSQELRRRLALGCSALFENTPNGILLAEVDNQTVCYANQAIQLMLGYSSEELMRLRVCDFHPGESVDRVIPKFLAAVEAGTSQALDIPCLRKDGSVFFADIYATRMTLEGREVIVGMFRDITESKLRAERILEERRTLECLLEIERCVQRAERLDQLMSEGLQVLLRSLECDRAWLYCPPAPGARASQTPVEWVRDGTPRLFDSGTSIPMQSLLGRAMAAALAAGQVLAVESGRSPLFDELAASFGYQHGLLLALHPQPNRAWLMGVERASPGSGWSQAELRLLDQAGGHLSEGMGQRMLLSELRESEARLNEIVGQAQDGIIEIGFDANQAPYVKDCNRSAWISHGYTREEMLGLPLQMICADRSPEEVRELSRSALATQLPSFENIHRRKDGSRFTVEVTFNRVLIAGRDPILICVERDISARKQVECELMQSQRWLETFLNNLPGMVYRGRNELNSPMDFVSQGALDLIGYAPEDLMGPDSIPFMQLIHPEDRNLVWKKLQKGLQSHKSFTMSYRLIRKNGGIQWVSEQAQGVFDAEGQLLAVEGIIIDIAERKRLEEQLNQSQKMEAVGQLAGGIAHDFNNLLQVINGYSEAALACMTPEHPALACLEQIDKAGERAANLVRQLLAFSRRQVLELKDIQLNEAVIDLVAMLRSLIGAHIQLEVLLGDELSVVHADRGQIQQILINLCLNARDAMPEGGTLTIESENVSIDEEYAALHSWARPGQYATLSVSDTGCGMDSKTQQLIFEPFFTTKKMGEGSGLGLSTVYGLIRQHAGMIHVYSEVGTGTRIKIYLPISKGEVPEVTLVPHQVVPGGNETILFAEDDEMILNLAKEVLAKAGYTVLGAVDGVQALEVFAANKERISLVVLDVIMPNMGGKAVYEVISRDDPGMRFLFASGYSSNGIHTNFILNDGLVLIQKPYKAKLLLAKVREVLDGTAIDQDAYC